MSDAANPFDRTEGIQVKAKIGQLCPRYSPVLADTDDESGPASCAAGQHRGGRIAGEVIAGPTF